MLKLHCKGCNAVFEYTGSGVSTYDFWVKFDHQDLLVTDSDALYEMYQTKTTELSRHFSSLLMPEEAFSSDNMQVDGEEIAEDGIESAIRVVDKYLEFGNNIVENYVRYFETLSYIFAFTGFTMKEELRLMYLSEGFNEQARNNIIAAKRYRYIQGIGQITEDEFELLRNILTMDEIVEIERLKNEADKEREQRRKTDGYTTSVSRKRTVDVESLRNLFMSAGESVKNVQDNFRRTRNQKPEENQDMLKHIFDANLGYYNRIVDYVRRNPQLGITSMENWENIDTPTVENVKGIQESVQVLFRLAEDSEANLELKKASDKLRQEEKEKESIELEKERIELEKQGTVQKKEQTKKEALKKKKGNLKWISGMVDAICEKLLSFLNNITAGEDSWVQRQLLKIGPLGTFIKNYFIEPFTSFISVLKISFESRKDLSIGSVIVTGAIALSALGAIYYYLEANLVSLGFDFGGPAFLNASQSVETGWFTWGFGLVKNSVSYVTGGYTTYDGNYANPMVSKFLESINLSFVKNWLDQLGPDNIIRRAVEYSNIPESSLLTFFRSIHQVSKAFVYIGGQVFGVFLKLIGTFISSMINILYYRELTAPSVAIEAFNWILPNIDSWIAGTVTSSPYFVLSTIVIGVHISIRFAYDILKLGFVVVPICVWNVLCKVWQFTKKFLSYIFKSKTGPNNLAPEIRMEKCSLVALVGKRKQRVVSDNSGDVNFPENIFDPESAESGNATVTLVPDSELYGKKDTMDQAQKDQEPGNDYGGKQAKRVKNQLLLEKK